MEKEAWDLITLIAKDTKELDEMVGVCGSHHKRLRVK
jgi:hypothetical protein